MKNNIFILLVGSAIGVVLTVLVVLLFFRNPDNGKKIKSRLILRNTPVTIEDIRALAKIRVGEFGGEEMGSLKEVYTIQVEKRYIEAYDSIQNRYKRFYELTPPKLTANNAFLKSFKDSSIYKSKSFDLIFETVHKELFAGPLAAVLRYMWSKDFIEFRTEYNDKINNVLYRFRKKGTNLSLEQLEQDYNSIRTILQNIDRQLNGGIENKERMDRAASDFAKYIEKRSYYKTEFNQLLKTCELKSDEFLNLQLSGLTWQQFKVKYVRFLATLISNKTLEKQRQKELIYVVRGKIYIDYDLSKINRTQLDTVDKILYINGLDPDSMQLVVNPNYYEGVNSGGDISGFSLSGLEQVYARKIRTVTDEETREVMNLCEKKLIERAQKMGVWDDAKADAERTIFRLYQIFQPQDSLPFEKVIIHHSPEFDMQQKVSSAGT